jgi:hypothetical protein
VAILQVGKPFFFSYPVPKNLLRGLVVFIVGVNICLFSACSVYGKSDGPSAWRCIGEHMESRGMKANETTVIVLGESHFMTGPSSLNRNITYRIPDSSALKMVTNSS